MAASSSSSKNIPSSSCCPSVLDRPTNPNARNSEACNPMRKSFTGTPFHKPSIIACQKGGGFNPSTPANSPSDCPRRNPIGRENIIVSLRDHEDKENGKDHSWKSARVRSPASVKVSKNFMSQTISASSKISPSPRKKVLADRNEVIRSSMTETVTDPKKEVSFDSTITYLGEEEEEEGGSHDDKEEFYSMLHTITAEDCGLPSKGAPMENDFKISPRASFSLPSPTLAPLDADPSEPLYDPKTNYLSPRPQFLHYKPNPRIELYLNKQINGKRLDEKFLFDSLSDTETTEDEAHSDVSHKESEDSCSGETLKEEEKAVAEISSISVSDDAAALPKRTLKPPFFKTRKFFALLFLTIAGIMLSLTMNSQIIDSSLLNNLDRSGICYVPREITEFTRKSLEAVVQQFQLQLSNLLSYGRKTIASFREHHKLGSLQYTNSTSLLKDGSSDGYLSFLDGSLGAQTELENIVLQPWQEKDSDIKSLEKDIEKIVGDDEQQDTESVEAHNDDMEELSGDDHHEFEEQESFVGFEEQVDIVAQYQSDVLAECSVPESEHLKMGSLADITSPGDSQVGVTEGRCEYIYDVDLSGAVPEDTIITYTDVNSAPDVTEEDTIEAAYSRVDVSNAVPGAKPEMLEKAINSDEPEAILAEEESIEIWHSSSTPGNQVSSEPADLVVLNRDISSAHVAAGVSLLALGLLTAATAVIFMKNRTPVTKAASAPLSKNLNHSPMSASEFDAVGESCPSEMSSFQTSKKELLAGTSEAQSYERGPRKNSRRESLGPRKNNRRESLASSDYSTGSPSYGSFTTYEKIPLRNGHKDEEFPPVRRSSRIRSQVTSP